MPGDWASTVAPEASWLYRLLQRLLRLAFGLLSRLDVQGIENVPLEGAVIIAPNHLHLLDSALYFALVRRRLTAFAAEKWRGTLVGILLLDLIGHAIYVQRGEIDRRALREALAVLHRGGALGVAPEGTRSRIGGLQQGKHGAAYLAGRSGAVIVPIAAWGQEKVLSSLLRLRRHPLHVRIGEPIRLPAVASQARSIELAACTDQIMLTLARMLPPEYRGVYADRL